MNAEKLFGTANLYTILDVHADAQISEGEYFIEIYCEYTYIY